MDAPSRETSNAKTDSTAAPSSGVAARLKEFASAASRVIRTQRTSPAPSIETVIGFDFGTSSTKVTIRTPFVAGGRVVAIPLEKIEARAGRFRVPTAVRIGTDGRFDLKTSDHGTIIRDLKVRLLELPAARSPHNPMDIRACAAGYVGLVLREARKWFSANEERALTRQGRIRWSMNFGIPSTGSGDEALQRIFGDVAKAGWALACTSGPITEEAAKAAVARCSLEAARDETGQPVDLNVVPEVAAEASGYARSSLRKEGLHFLLDIGASTVDLCGFVLHSPETGDDQYQLLECDVQPKGVYELHKYRLSQLSQRGHAIESEWRHEDPLKKIPDAIAAYSREPGLNLDTVDTSFAQACTQMLMAMLLKVRNCRDPLSPVWRTGVPLFIAGGGRKMKVYLDALETTSKRLMDGCNVPGLRKLEFPLPRDLKVQGVKDEDFPFLAVSYGLSLPVYQIGVIRPPSAADNIERHRRRAPVGAVDKEMT
ncbi:hypothetical protein [Myxococcus sp. CA040A]|uniref:hypothetical protein n=1 Tax=Myxococcus sp. CA040A TaxID=2741738 RepID=UPI001C2DD0AB|nr:hypothetical protein [Myxococcus sp. CA040A]NTX01948.1 hypothetical protein [Myxococcus sp. CA040A]